MNVNRYYSRVLIGLVILSFFSSFTAAPARAEWLWRNPRPQGDMLNSIVYGNGKFVAAGVGGRILISHDAVGWEILNSGVSENLFGVAFGNGSYVAVGRGFILVSVDGANWRKVFTGAWGFDSVSFQNGMFFATSVGGAVLTSKDGNEWQEQRPNHSSDPVSNVAFGNGQFVFLESSQVVRSADGKVWTPARRIRDRGTFNSITFGNGIFVAVGNNTDGNSESNVYTSPDTETWSGHSAGAKITLHSVTFAAGVFVAVGDSGTIVRSEDGMNWTPDESGAFEGLSAVAHGNGRFAAVGSLGIIVSSVDGTNWISRRQGSLATLNGIAQAKSHYVAVGGSFTTNQAVTITSSDGITWDELRVPTAKPLNGIAATSDRFIAVGDGGTILNASEPNQWRMVNSGRTNVLRAVAAGPNAIVAVGDQGTILTSPDGERWTSQASSETKARLYAATYGNGRYVIVGEKGLGGIPVGISLVSTNGIQWVPSALDAGYFFSGVAYGNGRFVAVGPFRIFISDDGLAWETIRTSFKVYPRAVAFSAGKFVAVGEDSILSSADGRNWIQEDSPAEKSLFGVAYGSGGFVAVGEHGTILQSGKFPMLTIEAPRIVERHFTFSITGAVGMRYRVEVATTLSAPNWLSLAEGILAEPVKIFVDNNALTNSPRFYRMVQLLD